MGPHHSLFWLTRLSKDFGWGGVCNGTVAGGMGLGREKKE